MAFRVFKRRWWKDRACTVPHPGNRVTIKVVDTEEEARSICRSFNFNADGERVIREYGLAYEYMEI